MAKSTRTLIKAWAKKYFDEELQPKNLRDEIGCSYVSWAVGYQEGSIQISSYGGTVQIAVLRDATDGLNNSKVYRFEKYKVANAALEAVSAVALGCGRVYITFSEVADVLEAILDGFPAESVQKNRPKKTDE